MSSKSVHLPCCGNGNLNFRFAKLIFATVYKFHQFRCMMCSAEVFVSLYNSYFTCKFTVQYSYRFHYTSLSSNDSIKFWFRSHWMYKRIFVCRKIDRIYVSQISALCIVSFSMRCWQALIFGEIAHYARRKRIGISNHCVFLLKRVMVVD